MDAVQVCFVPGVAAQPQTKYFFPVMTREMYLVPKIQKSNLDLRVFKTSEVLLIAAIVPLTNLERSTQRCKFFRLLILQLRPNIFKPLDGFLGVQAIAALKTNLSLNLQDSCVQSAAQQLLHILFN
jgi:hypothetical protein